MEIKAADVMKLRKMTGAGMMDCKRHSSKRKAITIVRRILSAKRVNWSLRNVPTVPLPKVWS